MKKTTQLKSLLTSPILAFLMEAHNGLSSKIVEEVGFKGIWASGLAISASLGVRDNNEASWTQIIDVLEFMSDATQIPILLDGDTGYGNFNNVRRLVHKLEQRGIAGVCIEDKLFPKTNSFINGEQQELAETSEFCGKIKAAKDTQSDSDFCVVARIEAFIAGLGLDEALTRAHAYADAGADALLIHSKKSSADDIVDFMRHWKRSTPIVIVPTKYYATPTSLFDELGISTIIWANHTIRAAIQAMQTATKRIFDDQHLRHIEQNVASVSEIFRLQGADELVAAEHHYLPNVDRQFSATILCAGYADLGSFTASKPKCLLPVHDTTVLDTQLALYARYRIHAITLVRGHHKSALTYTNMRLIDNDDYRTTSEVYSMYLARDGFSSPGLLAYGDIMFNDYFIHKCLSSSADIRIVVDATCPRTATNRDYVTASHAYNPLTIHQNDTLIAMGRGDIHESLIHGEFIGLMAWNARGGAAIQTVFDAIPFGDIKTLSMAAFFNELIKRHPVHIIFVTHDWVDMNTVLDIAKAQSLYA